MCGEAKGDAPGLTSAVRATVWSIVASAALGLAGCQATPQGELLGTWVGRPDTDAARAAREAERFGNAPTEATLTEGEPADRVTQWQRFDVALRLEFLNRAEARLQLDDRPPQEALWRLSAVGPASAVLELDVPSAAAADDVAPRVVRRRFDLLFDRTAGRLTGFTLTEVGADRNLGALYFQRAP